MEEIKNIIESLLFVAESPLSLDRLKTVLETADTAAIRTAIQELTAEYDTRRGGFYLREVAGGWQICTRPQYNPWVKRLLQPAPHRLSQAALETLAIVAYHQPIIRNDIEQIRGVDCGGTLRTLLERKLIRVLGRKEIPGRPLIYGTTKEFLEMFDLKDLKDLPSIKEIEAMGNGAAEEPMALPEAEAETQQPAPESESGETRETLESQTEAESGEVAPAPQAEADLQPEAPEPKPAQGAEAASESPTDLPVPDPESDDDPDAGKNA